MNRRDLEARQAAMRARMKAARRKAQAQTQARLWQEFKRQYGWPPPLGPSADERLLRMTPATARVQ